MNVQNRKSRRRKGQAMVRTVFGVGTVTAGVLAYLLSDVSRVEAIVLPGNRHGSGALRGRPLQPRPQPPANGRRPGTRTPRREVYREPFSLGGPEYSHGRARAMATESMATARNCRNWPFVPWRLCVQFASDAVSATEVTGNES